MRSPWNWMRVQLDVSDRLRSHRCHLLITSYVLCAITRLFSNDCPVIYWMGQHCSVTQSAYTNRNRNIKRPCKNLNIAVYGNCWVLVVLLCHTHCNSNLSLENQVYCHRSVVYALHHSSQLMQSHSEQTICPFMVQTKFQSHVGLIALRYAGVLHGSISFCINGIWEFLLCWLLIIKVDFLFAFFRLLFIAFGNKNVTFFCYLNPFAAN